ncbi:MAG: proton-conducting transporter membrane subunit [Candidatus Omnitrophica bacterium]|nr:proton-conducting transporter membrane subunit [Candidatus Omnitrophota bacterium]
MINFLPKQLFFFDPLAVFFLVVIGLVCVPSAIFSIGYLRAESLKRKILSWVLLIIFAFSMCSVVLSGNMLLFLICWEVMSLVSYFLVVFDFKQEKSIRAGIIYLVMTHAGTACLMAAFFILYNHAGSFDYAAVKQSFMLLTPQLRNIIFLLLFIGFATKAGVVPLHIWLPYAHPQAPAHISSIMSGVMIKVGIYGMMRFFITLLGPGPAWWGAFILALGIVSCLVGVIYALMDHDLKKLLAYHSVENIGIILLGLGTAMFFGSRGKTVVAVLAMCAGLYHLVNHALFKGLLFLCSGSVFKASGLRDMEKMGGLIKKMPMTALFFLIGAMGISALPPLNGFVSEWLTFQAFFSGVLESQGWVKIFMVLSAAALAMTSGLAAACFVKAFGISFLGSPRSVRAQDAKECGFSMKAGMALLAIPVILFGIGAGFIMPILLSISRAALGVEKADISVRLLSVLPAMIAVILLVIGSAVFLWFRFGLRNKRVSYNTWDCGYYSLDSRNEYTATAFSKPFRIAFSFFLLPYRKSEKIRDSFYHVRKFTYETHTTSVFKRFLYEPLLRLIYSTAFKMRKLQPGSIHLYIFYIFATLVGLITIAAIF